MEQDLPGILLIQLLEQTAVDAVGKADARTFHRISEMQRVDVFLYLFGNGIFHRVIEQASAADPYFRTGRKTESVQIQVHHFPHFAADPSSIDEYFMTVLPRDPDGFQGRGRNLFVQAQRTVNV